LIHFEEQNQQFKFADNIYQFACYVAAIHLICEMANPVIMGLCF